MQANVTTLLPSIRRQQGDYQTIMGAHSDYQVAPDKDAIDQRADLAATSILYSPCIEWCFHGTRRFTALAPDIYGGN